jgi:AhpD family alkylhydroperoxidase
VSPAGDLQQFKDFMAAVNAPGELDVKTKKAIAIALSLLAKCGPCAQIHIKKAREMGFTQAMIDEAANMAISFGGCPIMMFYNEVKGTK